MAILLKEEPNFTLHILWISCHDEEELKSAQSLLGQDFVMLFDKNNLQGYNE